MLFISANIEAVPRPIAFNGGSIYPDYFGQHSSPVAGFENSFAGAHYFSKPPSQRNANEQTYDAKTLAAFEAAFGDANIDTSVDKGAASGHAKDHSSDSVTVENSFLAAKDTSGQLPKADSSLPAVKAPKTGVTHAKTVAFPFASSGFDPIFGSEAGPRYEIQYSPLGHSFNAVNPWAGSSWNYPNFGFQPNFNSAFGPHFWDPSSYPHLAPFPSDFPAYPFPNHFPPGFDSKGLKPKGKGNGGKGEPTTES